MKTTDGSRHDNLEFYEVDYQIYRKKMIFFMKLRVQKNFRLLILLYEHTKIGCENHLVIHFL